MYRVLVTGGTGLVGRRLVTRLVARGHSVTVLTRRAPHRQNGVAYFRWDVQAGTLDAATVQKAEVLVHLAGENIAAGRWTRRRKRALLESRVRPAELLFKTVQGARRPPRVFISASAVGYYGAVTSNRVFTETDPPGKDFLAEVCRQWEAAALRFAGLGTRVVLLRTGVVLARDGGALPKLAGPVRHAVAVPLGSGTQHMPWIHIEDLVDLYVSAIESDQLSGPYNAVAPECPTNKAFMKTLAEVQGRPFLPIGVPGFLLRLVLGEMATSLLEGSCVSEARIRATGYTFRFPTLRLALEDLLATEQRLL